MTNKLVVFDGDDHAYLRWIGTQFDGFVLNTTRGRSREYMVLHRFTCWSISEKSSTFKIGGFTERDYIKICADDIGSLRQWVKENGRLDGSFSKECRLCNPSDIVSFNEEDF